LEELNWWDNSYEINFGIVYSIWYCGCCGKKQISTITWVTPWNIFQISNLAQILLVSNQLHNLWEGWDYHGRLCEIVKELINKLTTQTIDSKQNDVQLILNILPYSYEGVIQNISNQDQPVNFEWWNTKLLNESHKMQLWKRQLGDDELLIVQLQQSPFWRKGRWHCNYGGRQHLLKLLNIKNDMELLVTFVKRRGTLPNNVLWGYFLYKFMVMLQKCMIMQERLLKLHS
jgi:hypothetical protein